MRWPAWLGVGERRWKKSPDEEVQPPKTAWDFLQLLIVPGILVVIALAFNASQASRERGREDRRIREDRALAENARQDAVLDAYLAKMSGMILDDRLTSAKDGSAVSKVARTTTLTALRRLDGSRKGEVVRFLFEATLLNEKCKQPGGSVVTCGAPVIDLQGADLRGADLVGAQLYTGNIVIRSLLNGDLRGARFDHATLEAIDFQGFLQDGIDLRGASFNRAEIYDTTIGQYSDLRGASFNGALLNKVDFSGSNLRQATFDDAAIVDKTKFDSACLDNASFVRASFNTDPDAGPTRGIITTFYGASGNVDFSDSDNLSTVALGPEITARLHGANGLPSFAGGGGSDCEPEP